MARERIPGLAGLAAMIHEHTGETGPELEATTFYMAACLADALHCKDIGDYFDRRCQEAKAKVRKEPK